MDDQNKIKDKINWQKAHPQFNLFLINIHELADTLIELIGPILASD